MKESLGLIDKIFKGNKKQDCHEAFTLLIQYIHEDVNKIFKNEKEFNLEDIKGESTFDCANRWLEASKSKNDSIITEIFQGQFL